MLRDYQQDLYRKTVEAFQQGYRRPLVVAPCGAGKSYLFLEMIRRTRGEVVVLTHRQELKQQHEALLAEHGVTNARVAMVITEALHLGEHPRPALIVVDEAHLSRSNSWVKVIEHYDTFTVGFTATPIRLDGKPLGDVYDTLVEGVDVQWLIDHERLAPFTYYAPMTVDTDGLTVRNGDYALTELEKLMCGRAIYGDVIRSYEELAGRARAICYCCSLRHADETARAFRDAKIRAEVISSRTPPDQRRRIMGDFRAGTLDVLCNVGIISEGISIDDVSCCILLRPTESHALYWQQAMRCMRYQPGKQAIILDCVGNYTRNPMPDEPVEWSLLQSPCKKSFQNSVGDFTIRVCKSCYRTFKTAPVCPYCGEEYELHPREIQVKKDIELQRITAEEAARVAEQKAQMRREVQRARTYPELARIAQERGYSRGWIYQMMKARGKR